MTEKGILTVVSGFSGSGKGTLMQEMISRYTCYALSVSATTRKPREHERDGVDYFFVSKEKFAEMISNNEFYEYAQFQDNFYGTPRNYVDEKMAEGKDVILEIDVQGAESIREKFPDTVLIFVTPPSAEELRARLVGRGSETEEKIRGRLKRAVEEAKYMDRYDYVLVNDDLDVCVDDLHAIIRAEHRKSFRNQEVIADITEELLDINS